MTEETKDPRVKILVWVAIIAGVIWFSYCAAVGMGDEELERNQASAPCRAYANQVAAKAQQCPGSAGGLTNTQAQTINCQSGIDSGRKLFSDCGARIKAMPCETFVEGGFIDACFY